MGTASQGYVAAISAAESLDASELRAALDVPKPIIDWQLAEIGRAMARATKLRHEAERAIRLLEPEQARRVAEIRAQKQLEMVDGTTSWFITNPLPEATTEQRTFLDVFERCLTEADAALLEQCYVLCQKVHAHLTSWRTQTGETMDVSYARRIEELNNAAVDPE